MAEQQEAMIAYCPECGAEYDSSFNACPEDGTRLYHIKDGQSEGDPLIGEVIDERFRIEQVLGAGGMGKVYRAMQLSVDRPVALKVLHRKVGSHQDFTKRFLREARVVSGFNHPNIVRLVDFGQDADLDLLYLVMELLDGGDLSGLLSRGRFKPALALEVAVQVCAALSEPHAADVVHRDLKPENLMVQITSDGSLQIKVLDFGIAKAAEGGTKLTKTGIVFGTPEYMAPEQAGGGEVSARTDIYALGIILYQMLVGNTPFGGDTAMQVMLQHMNTPAPKLGEVTSSDSVPDSLAELVDDMVTKAPEDRPETVLEVRDRLEAIQQERGLARVRLDTTSPFEEAFEPWLDKPVAASAAPADGAAETAVVDDSHTPPVAADVDAHGPTKAASTADHSPQDSQAEVDTAVATPSSATRKARSRLPVIGAVLLVLIAAAAAALWVMLPVDYVGPGAEDAEYVWPWDEHAGFGWPGSESSELVWPWDERAGFIGSNSDKAAKDAQEGQPKKANKKQ